MFGESLTVQGRKDGLPLDQRVPYADAGFQTPASATFPSQPAAPGCRTLQEKTYPSPISSSAAARVITPPTTGYMPMSLPGSREPRGKQTGGGGRDPDTWSALTHYEEEQDTLNDL